VLRASAEAQYLLRGLRRALPTLSTEMMSGWSSEPKSGRPAKSPMPLPSSAPASRASRSLIG